MSHGVIISLLVIFGVILPVMTLTYIVSMYQAGVRSIGIVTLFNKKRRDMIQNIKISVHTYPKTWEIDQFEYEDNWDRVDMRTKTKNINVIFSENVMSTEKRSSRNSKNINPFIVLTLIERIQMQSYYRFLERWYKNEHENESIDKFFMSSTGFDEL